MPNPSQNSLADDLRDYILAGFSGLWIESHEHPDAIREMAQLCHDEDWRLVIWNIDQGLRFPGGETIEASGSDPLAAIRSINALGSADSSAILVLENFHRFLNAPEIIQAVARQVVEGRQNRTFLVVLSPLVSLPVELEKLFTVIEHQRPGRAQLAEIACGVVSEDSEPPEGPELETVLDAAAGLTRLEAENAFSLSVARQGAITAETVWELKTQTLRKSGSLELYRGKESFTGLGGLSALKAFCRRSLLQPGQGDPRKRAKGVLLLGVPGVGKSALCKALGNEVGRPTLILDVGALYGSLVGETERKVRQALSTIDAMQPAIVMVDEIEKALSGASSGQGDSGVSTRMFGAFLSWLADHESDVYVVASCNDISKLPPEFSRAERWDAVFFLDLPSREEKDAIWVIYLGVYGIDPDQQLPDDTQWTGAEVKSCCRLAALLDLPLVLAAQNVVPVAVTASESVERLRNWASSRCLSANTPGTYHRAEQSSNKPRRRVRRDPSQN